mmetsp:Transcript_12568/g.28676  ORF Transcript_12568/g.28676 Transcript_12568/m.28676 type:complete len:120 (-) Transcript_12568:16-375(-)
MQPRDSCTRSAYVVRQLESNWRHARGREFAPPSKQTQGCRNGPKAQICLTPFLHSDALSLHSHSGLSWRNMFLLSRVRNVLLFLLGRCASHDLVRLAAFDQFPYTPHLECGVVLERRKP